MIRFLRILLASVLALFLSVLLVIVGNTFDGTLVSRIAGRIPVLNNFILQTAPTFLYGKTTQATSIIKVSRYDIDFLASFTGPKGRYLALYPFKVEALLDLEGVTQDPVTGITTLPQPYYRSQLDLNEGTDGVFRKDFVPDYNTMRAPVLAMYQKRAVDFAVAETEAHNIVKERIVSRLTSLFGTEVQGWDAQSLLHQKTRFVPARFSYYADSSSEQRLIALPSLTLRDDLEFRSVLFGNSESSSWRFGLAGETNLTLDSFVSTFIAKNRATHVIFRYHDPIEPGKRTFVSLADTGYPYALSLLSNSSDCYYIESNENSSIGGESRIQSVAPLTLYLASALERAPLPSSETPSSATLQLQSDIWRAYLKEYQLALGEMKEGRFGRKFQRSLAAMYEKRRALENSMGLQGLRALDLALFQQCFDSHLGEAQSLETRFLSFLFEDSLGTVTSSVREESEKRFEENEEVSGNLAAFFYLMRDTLDLTKAESDAYLEDILSSGVTINRELLETLSSVERNRLLTTYFAAHLDPSEPQLIEVDDNLETETWYWYGQAALDWKDKKTRHAITTKLIDLGLTRAEKVICIFADPQNRAGFFTKYHALAMDGSGLTVFPDFGRWVTSLVNPVRIGWGNLEFSDLLLIQGERNLFRNAKIVEILKSIRKAWNTPFYNRERAAEIIQSDILKEAISRLERPKI